MGIQTDLYQKQHAEIKRVMGQVAALLDVNALRNNADDVRSLISRLVGKLSVHLALEDNVLYPYLESSSNPKLTELGKSFRTQVGGLRKALNSYKDAWPTAVSIQENPDQFVKDTEAFIDVIKKRVQLEDDELFTAIN